MTTKLTDTEVRMWLANNGITNPKQQQTVIDGIDFAQPVYLEWLDEGTKLAQFRDNPSAAFPSGATGGQWFALENHPGNIGTLGIGHGAAGRRRFVLTVRRAVQVLESTAKEMNSRNPLPYDRYRGPGGATQIFIPDGGLSSLG